MRRIKAIIYGVGTQGRLITEYMIAKGADIVGAIDLAPEILGRDLGEVVGLGYRLNVPISDDANAILCGQGADIAIVAIFPDMQRMYPILEACVTNGLNVITTSEEALYAWTTSPVLASKLDRLAKQYGVTVTGSGGNSHRVTLVSLLTAACHKIESINGKVTSNLLTLGPQLLNHYYVGETVDEFRRKAEKQLGPSSFRNTAESLIADLGLTIDKMEESVRPAVDDEDIMVPGLDKVVSSGLVTGVIRTFTAETLQGICFRGEQVLKVFNTRESSEGCLSEWSVKGIPNLHIKWDDITNNVVAAAMIVNYVPDVINSEPGYVTIEKLPRPKLRTSPLQYYVNVI